MVVRVPVVLGVVVGVTGVYREVLLADISDDQIILLGGFFVRGLSLNSCIGCKTKEAHRMKMLIRTAIHSILLDDNI